MVSEYWADGVMLIAGAYARLSLGRRLLVEGQSPAAAPADEGAADHRAVRLLALAPGHHRVHDDAARFGQRHHARIAHLELRPRRRGLHRLDGLLAVDHAEREGHQ